MINTISTSGHITYGLKDFVVDTAEEIKNLPIDCPMGSTAFVIATKTKYMLNGSKEWTQI